MTEAPKTIFAWPNEDGRGWYAGSCSDELTMCFADVEYTRTDLTPQWQPIETAPHNELVLLFCPDMGCPSNVARVELDYASSGERTKYSSSVSRHSWATHWQPLPAPPKETAE